MQTETIDKSQQATPQIEEELIDTLIAISVVAKRLAANLRPVSYTHLRAHETDSYLVCRLLLEKKKR